MKLILNAPSALPKAVEITVRRPYRHLLGTLGRRHAASHFRYMDGRNGRTPISTPLGLLNRRPTRRYGRNHAGEGEPRRRADDFAIPADLRQSAIVNRKPVTDAPFGSSRRPAQELAPGIFQVPGSWDVVEVRQPDGVAVLEGPLTSSYSVKVLDDVKTRLGAKVKAVITTSDAWPHIGGLREYAARGIPVLALDLNVPILERLFAARYATFPDTLRSRRGRR